MEALHARQQRALQQYERQAELQHQAASELPVNISSLSQFKETMDTLLATLHTVLYTIKGVASKLQAGDAKSDLLTLTELIVPLDQLAGEITNPNHG